MPDPIAPNAPSRRYDDDASSEPSPRKERVANPRRVIEPRDYLAEAPDAPQTNYALAARNPSLRAPADRFIDPDGSVRSALYTNLARMGDARGCRVDDTLDSLGSRAADLRLRLALAHDEAITHRTILDARGDVGTTAQLAKREQLGRLEAANPGSGLGILTAAAASRNGASLEEIRAAGEAGNAVEGVAGGVGVVLEHVAREKERKANEERGPAEQSEPAMKKVNGRRPINAKLAWGSYPLAKLPETLRLKYPVPIRFKANGFPDFEPHAIAKVRVSPILGDTSDFVRASVEAGFGPVRYPRSGYTWHHHENGEDMLLIPADLHQEVRHTGGGAEPRSRKKLVAK